MPMQQPMAVTNEIVRRTMVLQDNEPGRHCSLAATAPPTPHTLPWVKGTSQAARASLLAGSAHPAHASHDAEINPISFQLQRWHEDRC
jgi:hypothetical protein